MNVNVTRKEQRLQGVDILVHLFMVLENGDVLFIELHVFYLFIYLRLILKFVLSNFENKFHMNMNIFFICGQEKSIYTFPQTIAINDTLHFLKL